MSNVRRFPALERDAMTQVTDGSHFQPEGWHTVTPRIIIPDAERLVAFVKHVFGASGDYRPDAPTELRIGDSIVMISDAGHRDPMLSCLYVYVENANETWRRAVAAGACSIETPSDMPYGDRRGTVKDRWGNTWQMATRLKGSGSA
jgi:PhnB protein